MTDAIVDVKDNLKESPYGYIPSHWEIFIVKELIELGVIFKPIDGNHGGVHPKLNDFVETGIPFITAADIIHGHIDLSGCKKIRKEQADSLRKGFSVTGDVLLTHKATIGRTAIVKCFDTEYIMLTPQVTYYRTKDQSRLYNLFLKYFFDSSIFQELFSAWANSGSTRDYLGIIEQQKLPILLPPLQEQRAIATVLSNLDDKIDLLHRQNKTLEGIASALWRKIFIEDADPKWVKGKLEDYGKVICGKTPSKKVREYFGGNIPFIKIPDMHEKVFVVDTDDSLTEAGMESQRNKTIPARSICVSCIATVGLVAMNMVDSQTNQQINTIVPNKEYQRYFLFLLMRNMTDELLARASGGTATDNLNTGDFSRIVISIPADNTVRQFHRLTRDIFEKIYANQTQARTLSRLRDTLLPKLMCGEVRVRL